LVVNTSSKDELIQHKILREIDWIKAFNYAPRERLAAYQLVGGVTAYQDYDG
jgi:hypothetical protein